jgi:hypothetical protein
VSALQAPPAITEYLRRQHVEASRIVQLTGDASDRRYFRVFPREEAPFVLSLHAAPFDFETLPFVNVAALFAAMPVRVPAIIGHAADLGVLALEDLGDVTLQAHLGAVPSERRDLLYREAVDHIVTIQTRGRDLEATGSVPYAIAFDVEKLTWEMEFFQKHFLESYRGVTLDARSRQALCDELGLLVRELAAEPRVLCHRDYHSRNLMVFREALWIIDFQDARMGPDTYDLVSLLRDSYVDLPESLVDSLIGHYLGATERSGDGGFRERFDVMAMQRNLKALGTFGFQATSRANPVYAQYVPRTLRYVRDNLHQRPRFERLAGILTAHLPELG